MLLFSSRCYEGGLQERQRGFEGRQSCALDSDPGPKRI